MRIEEFSPDEQKVLLECVAALKVLPLYTSPEFELIFGNSKDEVEEVYNSFPNWDLYDEEAEGCDPSGDVLRNGLLWVLNEKDKADSVMFAKLSFKRRFSTHLNLSKQNRLSILFRPRKSIGCVKTIFIFKISKIPFVLNF